MEDWDSRHSQ